MIKIKSTILFLAISIAGLGQSFESFMHNVEQNNPRLVTLQKWVDAEERKAKTGFYPNNPEVKYNYLWGSSESIGNQRELEISQSFKLPGYYTSKAAIQKLSFQQNLTFAEKEKREILHLARSGWFKMVWLKKKAAFLKTRKDDAEKLVSNMQKGFEGGEISKPAFDKARIYNIGIQAEWQNVQSDLEIQKQYLQQLSGNSAIEDFIFEYPLDWEVPELDTLLSNLSVNHPDLVMAQLGIKQAENEVMYQRMNSLPSFEAGYKSEIFLDQKLQGFHAGISVPLWQNTNSVKHAKLQTKWYKANLLQQESEVKMQVSALYSEMLILKETYEQMRHIMKEETVSKSNLELLYSGQISFTEYLVENELVWDTQSQLLQNENAFFKLLSILKTYE